MTYKNKVMLLSILITFLAIIYVLSFVFDPGGSREKTFAWLNSEHLLLADGIEISGAGGLTTLKRINNVWVFSGASGDLPVKQDKVNDLFALLTKKNVYSISSANHEAMEKLGLLDENASRITIRGGAGLPLLDLIIGVSDALGREIYLGIAGRSEICLAEDGYSYFTEAKPSSWYDLRLLSNVLPQGSAPLTTSMVQQVEVTAGEKANVLRRGGRGWLIPGNESLQLDAGRIEAWLRLVLEAEGEDFDFAAGEVQAMETLMETLMDGSITLYLGDGSSRTIQIWESIENENTYKCVVSGSPLIYILSDRTEKIFFSLDAIINDAIINDSP